MTVYCPACGKPVAKTQTVCGLAVKVGNNVYHKVCVQFANRSQFVRQSGVMPDFNWQARDPETMTPGERGRIRRMTKHGKR